MARLRHSRCRVLKEVWPRRTVELVLLARPRGHPLVEPYNIFSYTFATMAFGQLSLATGNQEYADIAKKTFDIVLSKVDNPKGKWNKLHPGTRNLKGFALPMILCNLALEIEHLLDEDFLVKTMDVCIHEVMEAFLRPELGGIIVENLNGDNSLVDCFEGRQVTPGHAIEAMWFIMDLGKFEPSGIDSKG